MEMLFLGEVYFDRFAGGVGQHGGIPHGGQVGVFSAVAATALGADGPDVGHADKRNADQPNLGDALGRGIDRQAVLCLPGGDEPGWFGRQGVGENLVAAGVLDGEIRLVKPFLYIPQTEVAQHFGLEGGGLVGIGVVGELRVNRRRIDLHRFFHIIDRRQWFVVYIDQIQGALGDVRCVGGHQGHGIANKAYLAVQDRYVFGHPPFPARNILVGKHGPDPGVFSGSGNIDAGDIGVGMGASENFPVKHAGKLDIVKKLGFSGNDIPGILARCLLADVSIIVTHGRLPFGLPRTRPRPLRSEKCSGSSARTGLV